MVRNVRTAHYQNAPARNSAMHFQRPRTWRMPKLIPSRLRELLVLTPRDNEQRTNFPIFSVAFSMNILSSPDQRSIIAPTQIRITRYASSPFPPDWVRSSIFHGFRRSFAHSLRHVAQVFLPQSPIMPPALHVPWRHPGIHSAHSLSFTRVDPRHPWFTPRSRISVSSPPPTTQNSQLTTQNSACRAHIRPLYQI